MRWGVAGLWVAFALLLAIGGRDFLYACGLTLGAPSWNYCPAPIDRGHSLAEAERGERLQRLVHVAEMTLAEKPPCAAAPAPAPASPRDFNPAEHSSLREGAHEGKVEVYLSWNTLDDLDLKIFCPDNGQIGGQEGRPGSCGEGKLDHDANRNLTENVSNTPEEHAVWATTTPAGRLRVEAFFFTAVDGDVRKVIPFEMTFKIENDQKKCRGEVKWFPRNEAIRSPSGKIKGTENLFMYWTPSEGLPNSCDWKIDQGYYCMRGECDKR